LGFLGASQLLGDVAGRLAGAAVLGLALGLIVALIEAVFREAWLEVRRSPKEVSKVSLGRERVTIGSDADMCTVFAPGAAPVALRYQMRGGQITCEDVVDERTSVVLPGDQRQVGSVTVTVHASQQPASSPVTTGGAPPTDSGR
jgi:hypothetical protein